MSGILSAVIAFIKAVAAFIGWKQQAALMEAGKKEGNAEMAKAEMESENVLKEIADERSQIVSGGTADDIAKRLRSRKEGDSGPSGRYES